MISHDKVFPTVSARTLEGAHHLTVNPYQRVRARVYFFDATTGAELTDHAANGATLVGCGGYAQDAHGKYLKDTVVNVRGVRDGRSFTVRASGFDRAVIVKMWYSPDDIRTGRLV